MTPNQLHRSLLDAGHAPGDAITYYTGDAIPAGLYRRTGDRLFFQRFAARKPAENHRSLFGWCHLQHARRTRQNHESDVRLDQV